MRTTCLVNNYNYRAYLGEAIDSALAQSLAFDEIIVVDDGSTDGSVDWLQQKYEATPTVEMVAKENGGQLSAFNEGIRHATGDLIFFLDADDRYRPDYLRQAVATYQQQPVDFMVAGVENFGSSSNSKRPLPSRRNLGCSVLATLLDQVYIGGPTSSLSMRKTIADQVLPCPMEADWWARADDVLALGASIAGARKCYLGIATIDYRMHGDNSFAGKKSSDLQKYRHGLAVNRLLAWYADRMGYNLKTLPALLHREFATLERPRLAEWSMYLRMSWRAKLKWRVRFRHFGRITSHYWKERLRTNEPLSSVTTAAEQQEASKHKQHAA